MCNLRLVLGMDAHTLENGANEHTSHKLVSLANWDSEKAGAFLKQVFLLKWLLLAQLAGESWFFHKQL